MTTQYPGHVPDGVAYTGGQYTALKDLMVSILDLGYTQGAATYDVAHVINNRFFRLDWHLERFYQSSAGLDLAIPVTPSELTDILSQCVRRAELSNALVWMGVMQGIPATGNPRDYEACATRFYAYAKPYYGISNADASAGVSLQVSTVQRIPPDSVDPHLKNHHWLDLRRAQIEARRQGYDTTVLIDRQGNIAEGPGFSVCAVRNGTVWSADETALGSVTVRAIRLIADELGIPFIHSSLPQDEFRESDEVFIASTSGGITPVISVDTRPLPQDGFGPVSNRLVRAYWEKHSDEEWTTPVQ
jgi:branched-chain amino acid aminotransferase